MSGKKEIPTDYKYLPELEDRIAMVFEDTLLENFPTLTLSEDEQHNLKQLLKFLLSKNELDIPVKRFEMQRVSKYLISHRKNERDQGTFILEVLKRLYRFDIIKEIINNMPISQGTAHLTHSISANEEVYQGKIENLQGILDTLNKEINVMSNIKEKISQYTHGIELRISEKGEAIEYIRSISNYAQKHVLKEGDLDDLTLSQGFVFIYVGDLETKLRRVRPETWNDLVKAKDTMLVCIYEQRLPESSRYICKTLHEIIDTVKKDRQYVFKKNGRRITPLRYLDKNKRYLGLGGKRPTD